MPFSQRTYYKLTKLLSYSPDRVNQVEAGTIPMHPRHALPPKLRYEDLTPQMGL